MRDCGETVGVGQVGRGEKSQVRRGGKHSLLAATGRKMWEWSPKCYAKEQGGEYLQVE